MRLILEQRYLFDGSVAHVTHHHGVDRHHHENQGENAHDAPVVDEAVGSLPDLPATTGTGRSFHERDGGKKDSFTDIVFVDSRVSDWRELTASLGDNVGVVVVDSARDGMSVVSRVLSHQQDLNSVSFLTYGQSGQIDLGSATINAATIMADSRQVAQWGDALGASGQILFWGCDVGQGTAGQALVEDLHTLTGAGVAASTDRTGLATLGGDWTLELTDDVAANAVDNPFSAAAEAGYDSVLDSPGATADVAIANTAGTSTLLGNSFSQDITFTNPSTSVGYGPFVEVFAPSTTPLTSVSYLGNDLTVKAVTLTTDSNGVVGALNPYSTGANGQPEFVDAPSSFKAGDTMYVVSLPFGSYTPGQPAITLTAQFANKTVETVDQSSGTGAPIVIAAAGGYQYGNDALSDPATDPTIQGAVVSNSVAQDLVHVSAGIITSPLGEDEVPTGQDYPATYEVSVTPAAATAGNPITDMTLDVTLPNSVNYIGDKSVTITAPDGSVVTGAKITYVPSADGTTGGSLHVVLPSVAYDAGASYKVDVPVYVGQTDAVNNTILNTSGGTTAPTTIAPATVTYSGDWTPPGQDGAITLARTTVDTAPTAFNAKAFAVQETDTVTDAAGSQTDGQVMPGDTVTHEIHIENSDYYSSTGMMVTATLGDGQALKPGTDPTFTYTDATGTSHEVQLGSDYWSATPGDNGQTVVTMNIAQYLIDNNLPAMGAGKQGTISYASTVLDNYTASNTPVTEGDTVSSSVSVSALATAPDGTTSQVQDNSSSTLSVPSGTTGLKIVAVNQSGTDGTTPVIHAGDEVTYEATYTLKTGTYSDLDLSSYLPVPLYDTSNPTGTGDSAFTAASSTDLLDQKAGTYSVVSVPGGVDPSQVQVSTQASSNSISFDMGSSDIPASSDAGKTVTVLFTVKATSTPFADGLSLTSQEQSTFTNGQNTQTAQSTLQSVTVGEPAAVIKTGVVSVMNGDSAEKVTYTPQTAGEGTDTDPTTTFNAAGSVGGAYISVPAGGVSGLGAVNDLNATGAKGGDTVRIASTVENTGSADMYDLTVSGALPAGFSTADVTNFQITRPDGTVIYPSASSYFSTGGLTIPATLATDPVLAKGQDLTITYDLTLPTGQNLGDTLVANATVVNFGNSPGAVAQGDGFVTNHVPIGGQASDLTDPASITLQAPTISKTISASNLPTNDGVATTTSSGNIVSGETRTTTITVAVPEGTLTNGDGDVTVVETLPAGMDYAGDFVGTLAGVTASSVGTDGSLPAPTVVNNADGTTTLTFDLGRTVTNSGSAPGTITLAYNGYYGKNNAPANTDTITSSAVLNYSVHDDTATVDGPDGMNTVAEQAGPADVTVTERKPSLTETITDDTNGQPLYSGQKVTYTLTLGNNGDVTAYDIDHAITLPSGLTGVTITGGGNTITVAAGQTSVALSQLAALARGASVTYTITGTVANDLPADTQLTVTDAYTWHSAPESYVFMPPSGTASGSGDASAKPQDVPEAFNGTVSDAPAVGSFTSVLDIVGESNDTTGGISYRAPVTVANTVPGDQITLQGEVLIPEGQNHNVTLTLAVPDNVQLDPTSLRLLLASPNGEITSSSLGSAAQLAEGTTAALTMQGGGKTFTLTDPAEAALNSNGAAITGVTTDSSGQTVLTISLGTVTNNDTSPVPNYAIIQVAGTVLNTTANKDGTALSESLTASTSPTSTATPISTPASTVSETVKEPTVTLGKAVTAIDYTADTVTFTDILTNTGDATAYDVALDDPLVTGQETIAGTVAATGNGTVDTTINASGSVVSADTDGVTTSGLTLAAGASETVTYTVKLSDLTKGLAQTTTDVTWESLAGATPATSGGTAQSRDGSAGQAGTAGTNSADTYERSVTMGLGTLSGQIWQALGNTPGTYDSAIDTPLKGVGVTVTARGQDGTYANGLVQTGIQTDGNGNYAVLVPVYGTPTSSIAEITVPTTGGTDGVPASETEVYNHDGAVTSATTAVSPDAGSTNGMSATHADLAYELPDTVPTITGWQDTTPHVATAGAPTAIGDGGVTVDDHELDTLTTKESDTYSYAGTTLTVQRYADGKAAPSAADSFGVTGTDVSMAGGQVSVNGTAIGTYTDTGGVLNLTFNTAATKAGIATLAQDLTYTYTPTATDPATQLDVTLGATFSDGNTNLTGTQVTTGAQGTGGVQTSAPMFTRVSVGGSSFATTYAEPNDIPAMTKATDLGSYLSVEDASGTGTGSIQKVTVQIASATAEDVLAASTAGGITASMDSATGTLTLTAGTATTLQDWRSTLASLQYYDSSDTPVVGTRNVSISVFENGVSAPIVTNGTIAVIAANDSPILDPSVPVSLNDAQEDSGPPQGAVGTSVSQLVGYAGATGGAGNVTDPDGAGLTGQTAAGVTPLPGIAITSADTTHGTWWYSINNGRTWTEFAGSGVSNAIGADSALHLIDNGQARVYFQSTDPNWNGKVNDALTFRAWDQYDGAANGSISTLPAVAGLGTGINTPGSAYSSAVDSVALMDDNVNDAPNVVVSNSDPGATPVTGGLPASWQVTEDTPQAASVQDLFGSYFSDQTDQQHSATNPDGSTANTMAGVAIVGYTPTAAGTWSYSTDGGKTWTQLPAAISDTNALVLSKDAQLQFTPAANYNGQPAGGDDLKVALIDNSDATSGSPALAGADGQALTTPDGTPLTGAALDSGTMAIAGADVSTRGGQTALSVGTVDLSTAVTPVNDPPTMAPGHYTLPDVTSNSAESTNTGATVASLYGDAVQDGADAQQGAADPTGSTADHLAGVAITGNTANPTTQGTWQYSTDGGRTWTDVPADVSGSNALVLGDQATLRFDPVPNFTGTPGSLTTQVVESSAAVPITGTSNGVATSVTGQALDGTATALTGVNITRMQHDYPNGSVSTNSQPLDITVTPDSHRDISLPPGQEDQPGTKQTVSDLFTAADDPNGVGGVAITGNATPASEGTWMYSVPGGTAQALPTDLSATNAVVLPKDAQVWFQPASNFNGDPSNLSLTATVVDNTTATAFTGADGKAVAGDAITGVATGVDVSSTGGGTALDVVPVHVHTGVIPVNDAPVASGSATLPSEYTNRLDVKGDSVANLFGPTFSDQVDQQRSASNPDGSVADHLQGIAIVGNTANPATQGTWQYSTDGGRTWQDVSTAVSATAALVLPASAELHFAAVIGFTGTPGGLSAALVETNSTLATGNAAQVADVSALMADETSHVSQSPVMLNTNVTQQEGNPALSGSTLNNDLSSSSMLKTSVEDAFENEFQRGFGVAHQTWIRGTSLYRFVTTNQQYDVDVPAGAFISSDGTDLNLTITARQAGGAPLPDWVSFDADRRCFSMIAPDEATGSIDLTLIGRDEYGHEAEVDVHVVIGHEHPAWQMADDPSIPRAVDQAMQVVEQDMNWLAFNPDFHRGGHHDAGPAPGKKGLRAQMRQIGQRAAHARGRDLVNH
ncbi:hypothetical protein CFR78_14805 [Komagataeibacter rhaeticus]|uniref:DUF4347 domain-containing protein n=1 Tax=Komagataeibacter rhaeticus TaxID=215221 RepID=UPI000D91FE37|nr:DUF4347 domain-containing protein [Komagataeibacter rhaeticus]PYD52431.1 hypothetical protein CFR78_14805 [Komagataeibacter rhaeticus]GBQ11291.1 hypothetical protein AA16663_0805 [Komagataeibacter rhaeticus DSM 16663]